MGCFVSVCAMCTTVRIYSTLHCVHYGLTVLYIVYTMALQYSTLCTLWTYSTLHCVHYGLTVLYIVYTMDLQYCTLCTLWTYSNVHCVQLYELIVPNIVYYMWYLQYCTVD